MHPLVSYVLMMVAGFVGFQWCGYLANNIKGIPEQERRLLRLMRWSGIGLTAFGAFLAGRYLLAAG